MAWIRGDRVVLRAWERDDVRVRWEADQTPDPTEIIMRDWHEPPRSLQQREAEFDAAHEAETAGASLVIEHDGRPIGDINLFQVDQRNRSGFIGLSIWRPEDRDHGFGTDAIAALLRWAFRQYNLNRIELAVDPTNARAIHVYEKLGFTEEGRRRESHFGNGFYSDEVIMGILARDFEQRDRIERDRPQDTPAPEPIQG
jgi:RimJ/RimL family protein N-acetyltransferase